MSINRYEKITFLGFLLFTICIAQSLF